MRTSRHGEQPPQDPAALRQWLLGRISDIQSAGRDRHSAGVRLATGWREVDILIDGGLSFGAVHEWLGLDLRPRGRHWTPALSVLAHLVLQSHADADQNEQGRQRWTIWIGRTVWPYPPALARGRSDRVARTLFIDPPDPGARLWAIDVALRCPGVVVVADGSRFDMPATRRLQLSAEQGGSIALLARPPDEVSRLSAAATRWRVDGCADESGRQRWAISLLRGKGALAAGATGRMWLVERSDDGGLVAVPPEIRDRSCAPARAG